MEYVSFCKNFFAATNIPISLLKSDNVEYSALGELLSFSPQAHPHVFPPWRNPCFVALSSELEYGQVRIEGTDYDVILGPAFSIPVTEQIVRQFMHESMTPLEYREQLSEYLCSMPRISRRQFTQYLAFIHLCLNDKEVDIEDFYTEDESFTRNRMQRQVDTAIENMENENFHNSYSFELEMYQHIRNGNVDRLKDFLRSSKMQFKEGKLAHTPLRQSKNLFIGVATKVGMLGAIPGGVDVEKTYQLIDFYIQECEQLQSIEEISRLQYVMVMDFCQRAGENHIPDGISQEVYQCMNYIRSHTNEPISVDDVASQVHRSSSYMMKRFKEELGIHIGAFITRCKLEEAKSLLTYSDKSLTEISNYLCFSSQSYFQNVFKKQYGITPMQYRKKERKL